MDALATIPDLEARLGRHLTEDEAARAGALLDDASSSVRGYTDQTFTLVEDDEHRFKVRRGVVRLPQRPVIDVTAVADINGNAISYTWDGLETVDLSISSLQWFEVEPRRTGLTVVDITYSHGYEEIPSDVIGVVCSIVLRSVGTRPNQTALQSETIEGYGYTLGSAAAAGGFGMLADERRVLDRYRRTVGFIDSQRLM